MPLRRIKANAAVLLGALGIVLAVGSYYTAGQQFTKLVLDILLFGVAIVVFGTWFFAALDALRNGAKTASDKVILTVWGTWTAVLVQRIYVLVITALSTTNAEGVVTRPLWLTDSPVSVFLVALFLIAGLYAAYATVSEADVPVQERRSVLIATFVGGLAVGVVGTAAVIFGFTF